jgi:hypothetical protein
MYSPGVVDYILPYRENIRDNTAGTWSFYLPSCGIEGRNGEDTPPSSVLTCMTFVLNSSLYKCNVC